MGWLLLVVRPLAEAMHSSVYDVSSCRVPDGVGMSDTAPFLRFSKSQAVVGIRCLAVIFLVLVTICWGAVVDVVAAADREDCSMVRVSAARGVGRRAGHGLCHCTMHER